MFTVFFPAETFALLVSGGFDSAVMLHLYCLEAKKRNQSTLNCITADKNSGATHFSKLICDWAKQKHQIEINQIFVSTPEHLHHSMQINNAAQQVSGQGFKTLICAETKNPPVELPGEAPVRTPQNLNLQGWHFPFADLNKKDTVNLANELGILEDVSILSHTCTQTVAERCGECWQCSERQWAFNELGFEDPGNY